MPQRLQNTTSHKPPSETQQRANDGQKTWSRSRRRNLPAIDEADSQGRGEKEGREPATDVTGSQGEGLSRRRGARRCSKRPVRGAAMRRAERWWLLLEGAFRRLSRRASLS